MHAVKNYTQVYYCGCKVYPRFDYGKMVVKLFPCLYERVYFHSIINNIIKVAESLTYKKKIKELFL